MRIDLNQEPPTQAGIEEARRLLDARIAQDKRRESGLTGSFLILAAGIVMLTAILLDGLSAYPSFLVVAISSLLGAASIGSLSTDSERRALYISVLLLSAGMGAFAGIGMQAQVRIPQPDIWSVAGIALGVGLICASGLSAVVQRWVEPHENRIDQRRGLEPVEVPESLETLGWIAAPSVMLYADKVQKEGRPLLLSEVDLLEGHVNERLACRARTLLPEPGNLTGTQAFQAPLTGQSV